MTSAKRSLPAKPADMILSYFRIPRISTANPVRRIALTVGLLYFLLSVVMFRNVILNIPIILSGDAVINGDELVPFFNPYSQLLDQAAGKFNQLTNGYEFRVRYAFHTTWVRYYKVLPFAIVIVIPMVAYWSYLAVAWFLSKTLPQFKAATIYTITAAPVLVIFLIMTYAKITHFYTLILGFSLYAVAIALMTYGLIFPQKNPYKPITAACLITLFNPAVHYLVLFALFMSLTVAVLMVMDAMTVIRSGSWRNIYRPRVWWDGIKIFRQDWKRLFVEVRFWRSIGAFVMLALFTLAPYGAFVKFYALRGVANLSETVPADYYFIVDASISLGHLLAFDMAGIMDKMTTGDYLSKVPRWANAIYTALMFMPLFYKRARDEIFNTEPLRAFMIVAYASTFFSMWATLGYTEPSWLPTFHRTMLFISNIAYSTRTTAGDLVVRLFGTVVQVLRFPHRFEFIMFVTGCLLVPISLVWIEGEIAKWATPHIQRRRENVNGRNKLINWKQLTARLTRAGHLPLVVTLMALIPMFSNTAYTKVFFSGDFNNFLTPYPVGPLKEVKEALLKLPPGKVVVLPPTETAKEIVDINGVTHKFIDKFHIYYLDLPSFYYGLTGDSDNKHEFFLLLRAMYYEQPWWVNIARDIDLKYIVVNKELVANTIGGQEYLREVERFILPELDRRSEYVKKIMENESYALYEFTDLPKAERVPLYIDTSWNTFIQILSRNLELTRYYDLRYSMISSDLKSYDRLSVVTDDERSTTLDLYIKQNPTSYFRPSSTIMAFNPDLISSSYYLSPMFRLFQFFSDSKWNRLNMITPGLWGSINGGFIGVPRATQFRIDVTLPEDGTYYLLMRGAASSNNLEMDAKFLPEPLMLHLASDQENLVFFDKSQVFSTKREPMDISIYTQSELDKLIPADVVVVNYQYQFFDLAQVTGTKGKYTLYFDKLDNSPLLVEGVVVVPEALYQNLILPEDVQLLQIDDLCCGSLIQETETLP
ncbi:MAG: hypothetical protein IPN96_01665 [Anaerolineales bacterium]|nr:hypothetical protein [Anaerolineales bacterium]